jgi:hypothetical protein
MPNNYTMKKTLLLLSLLYFHFAYAQNDNYSDNEKTIEKSTNNAASNKLTFDMSLALKSMNVFRGLIPSKTPAISTQAGVLYKNFIIGFYGGSNFNGTYQETDLILMYNKKKFDMQFQWYYNYTDGITNIPTASGFLDLNPETTRGFGDVIFNYKPNKHWKFMSSTLVYGRDRGVLPSDAANNILLRRGDQRYTEFLEVMYHCYYEEYKLSAHVGGSFSLADPSGPTFYANKAGIHDIGFSVSRNLFNIPKVEIPFKASVYINPLSKNVYFVATLQLLALSKI